MNKLILITGGSASGKTHLAMKLASILGDRAICLSQDSFYKPGGDYNYNYDIPEAFDFKKQQQAINDLINNKEINLPIYDFEKHDVVGHKKTKPAEFIIFEGLFSLFDYETAKKADLKIFVDTPADTRLSRRIIRDTETRGRKVQGVISRWLNDVQPSYKKFITPVKKYADVVIPWHKLNNTSIKSIIVTIINLDYDIQDLTNNNI